MVTMKMCFSLANSFVLGSLLSVSLGQAETLLLDFASATCGPCQQMRPTIQRLYAAGYKVRHVDIGREPEMAQRFHVDVVPTFIAFTDNHETARVSGPVSYQQLVEMLTPAEPSEAATSNILPVSGQTPLASQSAPQDLDRPVPDRILEIQNPNRSRPPQSATRSPFSNVSQGPPVEQAGSPALAGQLLEATVKLSVEDADGISAGTGTIVDAQAGAALVLTCGHLFRTSEGKGPITVTLFKATPSVRQIRESVAGQLMDYDLERDLALVIIRPKSPVRAQRIGAANTPLSPGLAVTSVGCNQGANPTVMESKITTIDRYEGAPNIEVAGAPIEGRSGGGLFNSAGQLIGVCFAADPQSNEGLYASLPAIHAKLDSMNLSMVYGGSTPPLTASGPQDNAALAKLPENVAVRGQDAVADTRASSPPRSVPVEHSLSSAEQAALQEIKRRGSDSEVICIIRPRDPAGKSEVITLHSVSPQFVDSLVREHGSTPGHVPGPSAATAAAGQLLR